MAPTESASTLMPTYARLPVTFVRGEGARLFDAKGRAYLDGLSGIGVTALGHSHPAVTAAIQEQAANLLHCSNLYHIETQEQLGQALTRASGMSHCFFGNSGAEANEAAIKLARLHGHQRGVKSPAIVVMENAFHGRTLATLSATGNRKIQAGFEPLVQGFVRARFNDIDALHKIAQHNHDVVAVLVEPVQGEGGVRVADDAYLQSLRTLCDAQGWLLMLDEVQTGNGRTGSYFAYQQAGILPDVVTTAKGLGNGVPIGACLAQGAAAAVLGPGHHGSTYGGNPLACAAAHAVVTTITRDKLAARAGELGARIRKALAQALADCPRVVDIRGRGLMIGLELDRDCPELVAQALSRGLLINVTAGSTIRLLPPLVLSDAEADELVQGVAELVRALN